MKVFLPLTYLSTGRVLWRRTGVRRFSVIAFPAGNS
jgi:hypothetical protein